jgi:hypothetical protein
MVSSSPSRGRNIEVSPYAPQGGGHIYHAHQGGGEVSFIRKGKREKIFHIREAPLFK